MSSSKSTIPEPTSTLQIVTTTLPAATINQAYTDSLGAAGGVQPYNWSVGSGNLPTGVALSVSGMITGTATNGGMFNVTIKLTDSSKPPQTATAPLSLQVNTAAVQPLQITVSSLANASESSSYSAQLTATGGSGALSWSVASGQLPSGITLNATSGMLSGTATQSGSFSFTAAVQDSESTPQRAAKSLTLAVSAPGVQPLQISSSSVPSAVENSSYSAQLTATGGSGALSWSVASGQLPSGIALNATSGILSGTATQSGSFSFTAQVQDSESTPQTATKSLTLAVSAPGVQPLQITTSSLATAVEGSSYSAQLAATGGSGTLSWSVASGQLPPGITLSTTSGALSGTATQSGSFSFTAQVQDSESAPQTATKSLTLSVTASSGSSPAYYGSGIASDSLSNQPLEQINGSNYLAAYRFRATHTGSIQAVHFYLIVDKPGYSAGNGGEVEVDLETDDGSAAHNPSGTVLATYTITNPQAGLTGPDSGSYGYFPTVTFASPVPVTAGQLYHMVFSNPSADPSVNFVSLDSLDLDNPSTPVQPTVSDTDLAVLRVEGGGPWTLSNTLTPIFQVDYTDGTTTGQGYMEVWVETPEPISGTAEVREAFTNNSGADIAVTSVSVRVNRTVGTAAMTVRLEQSDGTLIEQGSVASSSVPIASDPTWVTYTFSAVRTLLAGQGYNLVLEAPSGTTYTAYPIRKGVAYGFATNTVFNDGYAQFNPGTGWVGWTQWGVSNRTDGDLQFYFTTTP